MELSKWRAGAMAKQMELKGIAKSRLRYDGNGTDGGGKRTSIFCAVTWEEIDAQAEEEVSAVSKRPDVIANRERQRKVEKRAEAKKRVGM